MTKDVVIVGAGMVGLSVALALQKKGLQVAIIESKVLPNRLSDERIETRVSAINHNSQKFLKEIGVWSHISQNRISPYYTMSVWDHEITNNISITAEELSEHSLGHIVENQLIVETLLIEIAKTDIEILDNVQIQEIQILQYVAKVKYSNGEIETDLIIGADGANSFVRDYFNFETKTSDYNHTAIVATVELEKSHKQTAYQRFYDKGVLAFLPLETENKCSIVWSVKTDYAEYLNTLTDIEFKKQLATEINDTFGGINLLTKRITFPLFERYAKKYVQDKVALVGDACHSLHPLAGQGVNLGFKDAQSLITVISDAFEKGRIIGDISTLDKYQRQRKLDNVKMMLLMRSFKEAFASDNVTVSNLRKIGLGVVNSNNMIKRAIVKQAL